MIASALTFVLGGIGVLLLALILLVVLKALVAELKDPPF